MSDKAKILNAIALAAALAAAPASAQAPQDGPECGPGMMGGYGQGMMGGYGPGMTGGYGRGMGGPGMMGGYGRGMGGPGMMGGQGRGAALFDLTDEQREKIASIHESNRRANWGTMGELRSEMFKLRGLYGSTPADAKTLVEQQAKVDELRRKMLASRLEAHKQVEQVLTPEQRKQSRGFGPWWMQEE